MEAVLVRVEDRRVPGGVGLFVVSLSATGHAESSNPGCASGVSNRYFQCARGSAASQAAAGDRAAGDGCVRST